jgi:hypothetical protein
MAEAVMGFFFYELEAGALVDMAGRVEQVVSPEYDVAILGGTGEADALADQGLSQALTAGGGFYEEQPELGGLIGFADEKDASDGIAVMGGNPAGFPGGVEVADELGDDFGD